MKKKDIMEWMLDEGIDPLTTITTQKGEMYLSDILTKHLTEQYGKPPVMRSFCQHTVTYVDSQLILRCSKCKVNQEHRWLAGKMPS